MAASPTCLGTVALDHIQQQSFGTVARPCDAYVSDKLQRAHTLRAGGASVLARACRCCRGWLCCNPGGAGLVVLRAVDACYRYVLQGLFESACAHVVALPVRSFVITQRRCMAGSDHSKAYGLHPKSGRAGVLAADIRRPHRGADDAKQFCTRPPRQLHPWVSFRSASMESGYGLANSCGTA